MQATTDVRGAVPAMTFPSSLALWGARIVGAAMIGATAAIHLYLYAHYGYRHIPKIGTLFLLNGIGGSVLCLSVLGSPRRLLGLVALAAAGYELLTLAGFVGALYRPLFGFEDSIHAPLWKDAVTVESIGIVVLGAIVLTVVNRHRVSHV
jgi:hypothetical protein